MLNGVVKKLVEIFWKLRTWIALSIIFSILTLSASVALFFIAGWLISSAALRPSIAVLQLAIVSVRFFGISRAAFRYLERLFSHDTTLRLIGKLRVDVFKNVAERVPFLDGDKRSSDFLSRIVEDIESLEGFYVRAVAPVIQAFVVAILSVILVCMLSINLGVMWGIILVLNVLILPILCINALKYWKKRVVLVKEKSKHEAFSLFSDLQYWTLNEGKEYWLKKVLINHNELCSVQGRIEKYHSLYKSFVGVTLVFTLVLTLASIGELVIDGNLAGVWLAAWLLGMLALYEIFNGFGGVIDGWSEVLLVGDRLFANSHSNNKSSNSLYTEFSTGDGAGESLNVNYAPEIFMSAISFAYPERLSVFTNFSFCFERGKVTVISGESGLGKTTLIFLLRGLLKPESGMILFDGEPLNKRKQSDFVMPFLQQNDYIFSGTVRENLAIGNRDATDDEMISVLERVELASRLNELSEDVGTKGAALSGGERHRLALARAFLSKSPVLFLDEPLRALDGDLRKVIANEICANKKEQTVIVVSHFPELFTGDNVTACDLNSILFQ